MSQAAIVAELMKAATRRTLDVQEIAPALEWLESVQAGEVAEALRHLAELESERLAVQRRSVDVRERQIDLISKHIAPRLLWARRTLVIAAAAGIAAKAGLPVGFLLDDLP